MTDNESVNTSLAVVPAQEREPQTPAQARVDTVARTMDAAMNKASTLTLTSEEVALLKADFPDEAFKPGAAGKEHLIYIEHAFLRDRLDAAIGMGQWALIRTRPHWAEEFTTAKGEKATRIYADVALLIRGCMVSEAIGEMVYYPNNASQNYGDAAEGAVTAAFRRCAKNFGVGLQAWKKDFGDGWWQRKRGQPTRQSAPPASPAPVPSVQTPKPASSSTRTPRQALDALLEASKAKLIRQLIPVERAALEYFVEEGLIFATQTLADMKVEQLFSSVDFDEGPDENKAAIREDYDRHKAGVQRTMDADQIPGAEVSGEGQGSPASASELALPPGVTEERIVIKTVSVKHGETNGKQWTRYGVCDNDDRWLNTFSESVFKTAEVCKGREVTVRFTTKQYQGRTQYELVSVN